VTTFVVVDLSRISNAPVPLDADSRRQSAYFRKLSATPMMTPGPLDPHAETLIGRWNVEGVQLAMPDRAELVIRWVEEYEWLEGRFFILHRVQGHVGAEEFNCTEIIANEEIHSFYNHGRHQVWSHWCEGDRWMIQGIWREAGHQQVRCTNNLVAADRREALWERSIAPFEWVPSWRITAVKVV